MNSIHNCTSTISPHQGHISLSSTSQTGKLLYRLRSKRTPNEALIAISLHTHPEQSITIQTKLSLFLIAYTIFTVHLRRQLKPRILRARSFKRPSPLAPLNLYLWCSEIFKMERSLMASTFMQEARIPATISYHLPCNLPSLHRDIELAGRACPESDKIRRHGSQNSLKS